MEIEQKEYLRDIVRKIRLLAFKEGFDFLSGDMDSCKEHREKVKKLHTEFCQVLGVEES